MVIINLDRHALLPFKPPGLRASVGVSESIATTLDLLRLSLIKPVCGCKSGTESACYRLTRY